MGVQPKTMGGDEKGKGGKGDPKGKGGDSKGKGAADSKGKGGDSKGKGKGDSKGKKGGKGNKGGPVANAELKILPAGGGKAITINKVNGVATWKQEVSPTCQICNNSNIEP